MLAGRPCGSERPGLDAGGLDSDGRLLHTAAAVTDDAPKATVRRRPRDVVADVYSTLGRTAGRRLYEEVVRSDSLAPRLTAPKAVAAALAAIIHGVTLALLAGGILLVVVIHEPWSIAVGLILLAAAWSVRPRLGKEPKRVEARGAVPALYDLVDRVAKATGSGRIDGIVLAPIFNANVSRTGWRRRAHLTIGVPLFEVLGPQERVALLAHELGHEVNGDPRRTGFIGSAIGTLAAWNTVLTRTGPRRRGAGGIGMFVELAETLTDYVTAGIAVVVRLIARGMLHLVWHESQRAEYLADDISRRVAGTDAAIGALRKLPLVAAYREAVQSVSVSGSAGAGAASLFRDFRARALERFANDGDAAGGTPEKDFRLDTTHPPTPYRIEFLRARTVPAQLTLTHGESDRIDRELEPIEERLQREITEEYRASLYRGNKRR